MNKILSPLRYPGSKIKLVKYISKVLEFNHFKPKIIVEPFVGGGSVFLNLLENKIADAAVIGDKDKLVFSFWKILFEKPEYLIKFVKNVQVNLKNFNHYKKIAAEDNLYSEEVLAEACLFLNRTSFSGILAHAAGPIGGKSQVSDYAINCRFNKTRLVKKIEDISKFSSKVTILPFDWRETVAFALNQNKRKKILFYFDPPFYNKADKLYRHFFKDKKLHVALSRKLNRLRQSWILSYDRAPEIKQMYKTFLQGSFAFPYSINSPARRIEQEYFITSKDLKHPDKKFLTK